MNQQCKNEVDFPQYFELDKKFMNFDKIVNKMYRCLAEVRNHLEVLPIKTAIKHWLIKNSSSQEKNHRYTQTFEEFFKRKIINEVFANGSPFTVGGFRYIKHETVIDYINKLEKVSEHDKRNWINCYKAFLLHLNEVSFGWFGRSVVATSDQFRLSKEALAKEVTFSDWRTFIYYLSTYYLRDSLIARCLLQGTRRITEVLNLTLDRIDFQNNKITFKQRNKAIAIEYEKGFMSELKEYIESSSKERKNSRFIFVTKNGKAVVRSQLSYSFEKVCSMANIKRISPESLRMLWVLFGQQGYSDEAIMDSKRAQIEGYVMAGRKKNWIQDAIKKPGSLRKALHVKKGKDIPAKKLKVAAKKKGKVGKRARLALTLKKFSKKKGLKRKDKPGRIKNIKKISKIKNIAVNYK